MVLLCLLSTNVFAAQKVAQQARAGVPVVVRGPGDDFEFPRVAPRQERPLPGVRPLACETTCFIGMSCRRTETGGYCTTGVGKCRNTLYCDDCERCNVD